MKRFKKYSVQRKDEISFSDIKEELDEQIECPSQSFMNAWSLISKIPQMVDSDLEKTIKDCDLSFIREEDESAVYVERNKKFLIEGYKAMLETNSKKGFILALEIRRPMIINYISNIYGKDISNINFETAHLAASLYVIYKKMSGLMNHCNMRFDLLSIDGKEIEFDADEVLNLANFFKTTATAYKLT